MKPHTIILNLDADTVTIAGCAVALARFDVPMLAARFNVANGDGHTHVVFIPGGISDARIAAAAQYLGEDCIAALDEYAAVYVAGNLQSPPEFRNGRLLGPHAGKWLPFNAEFFIAGR